MAAGPSVCLVVFGVTPIIYLSERQATLTLQRDCLLERGRWRVVKEGNPYWIVERAVYPVPWVALMYTLDGGLLVH